MRTLVVEFGRVVEIYQDGKSRGSGYLITPRHVLTARHVPKPSSVGTSCQVLPLRSVREQLAPPLRSRDSGSVATKVGWVSDEHDLAVLELSGDALNPPDAESVPFGEIPDDGVMRQVVGSGFPEAAGTDQRTIVGTVAWVLTGSRRFDVDVISAIPRVWNKWAGFSGAAIFADNLLVGVVRTVDESWNGGVLEATPAAWLLDDSTFRKYCETAGVSLPKLLDAGAVDRIIPLDFERDVSIEGTLRFSPRNPRVPFLGRERELAALEEFLDTERRQPFSWWLVTGGGGAGKTRLARELCLRARQRGWRAGFLPSGFETTSAALDAWCPRTPTLIVADYVMQRVATIRTLAARLARRDALPRLRLLLLEREAGELFERKFLGFSHSDRGVIEHARYRLSRNEVLNLSELTDDLIWDLVQACPWRVDGARVPVTRPEFFKRLRKLDAQRRVLVAMILADALATSRHPAGLGSLETELRDLLSRDRDNFWPAELSVAGLPIGASEADVTIAFATMADGLHLGELKTINEKRGQPLSPKLLPLSAEAVGKSVKDQRLGRLEPDLIGEFFALEALTYDFADPPHDWMPQTAWQMRGSAMEDFVRRARQNFPAHPAIERVAITVPGVPQSWVLACNDALRNYSHPRVGNYCAAAFRFLSGPAESDIGAAKAAADFVLWTASIDPQVVDAFTVYDLLHRLYGLCEKHTSDSMLRAHWAQAVSAFVSQHANPYRTLEPGQMPNIGYREEGTCFRLCVSELNFLFEIQERRDNEPELRTEWANGVASLVLDGAQRNPAECRALLDQLAALQSKHPTEPALRLAWAGGVVNLLRHCASRDPVACSALLDDLAQLASAYSDEPLLRTRWAQGVSNFMYHRQRMVSGGRLLCPVLLDELAQLSRTHCDEADLRNEWAWSVAVYIYSAAGEAPADCHKLLNDLTNLIGQYPNDPLLREPWVRAVANFVRHQAGKEAIVCSALVDRAADLCNAHPDELVLRQEWERARSHLLGGQSPTG